MNENRTFHNNIRKNIIQPNISRKIRIFCMRRKKRAVILLEKIVNQ